MNDTIHIFVRRKVINVSFQLFRFNATSVSDLLSVLNIDMFNEHYQACSTHISNLIKYLNTQNIYNKYDVQIHIMEQFEDSIIQGYTDNVENGEYCASGNFYPESKKTKREAK